MTPEFEQAWNEPPVAAPPRTRLYRLEPIGLGTSMVECVSSYIHRLAAAHGIPTWGSDLSGSCSTVHEKVDHRTERALRPVWSYGNDC